MFPTLIAAFWFTVITTQLPITYAPSEQILATHSFSMSDRYGNEFVNNVFKDNILLTLSYLSGQSKPTEVVNWTNVEKPFSYAITLKKGETFAFHDTVLPKYQGHVDITTHAHFSSMEGFKSDGDLVGDGVCHLASLLSWSAKDAGLAVEAPTNHDFAVIPEVPQSEGVAIYDTPQDITGSQLQNLYITNNKDTDVTIIFLYDGKSLTIRVAQLITPSTALYSIQNG